jgi:histidyl-tRNA synthetase
MEKIAPVRGTRDFYPEQMAVRNWITAGWRAVSRRNGFEEYDAPIFEYLQLYTQKSGEEIVSQLFSMTDRGGRELAIRPEITPSLARMINQQINSLPRPVKWFSVPRLCRAERPQKGRLREFFQWNIDIIGDDSPLADAECIFTAIDYLRSVGLTGGDVVAKISSRSMLAAWLRELGVAKNELDTIYALLDKRPKLPEETFQALAEEKIPNSSLRKNILNLMNIRSLDELNALAGYESVRGEIFKLESIFHYLKLMGVSDYCEFDINVVRGLAYYTGMVFEVFDRSGQLRALCGGGRYDNLLAVLGGPQVSATGFGMGDVVLEILLREKNLIQSDKNDLQFYVIDAGEETYQQAIHLACQLRAKGFSAGFSYKRQGLGKQLKQASSQNARCAVILGQETIDNHQVTIKNMTEGLQKTISLEDFLAGPDKMLT